MTALDEIRKTAISLAHEFMTAECNHLFNGYPSLENRYWDEFPNGAEDVLARAEREVSAEFNGASQEVVTAIAIGIVIERSRNGLAAINQPPAAI